MLLKQSACGSEGLVVTLVAPDEAREVRAFQKDAGINLAIVPMKPGDERLRDLASFEPEPMPEAPAAKEHTPRAAGDQRRPFAGGRGNGRRPFRPREVSPAEGGSRRHNRAPRPAGR